MNKKVNYQASINKIRAGVDTVEDVLAIQNLIDNHITKEECEYMLDAILDALWKVDIPHPTVPAYIEHHEQIQNIMCQVMKLKESLHE